ncbi:hypothetical protein TSUD_130780 [Trifolium subterraneum]|nr:hypothetical protein TSUD_130780 [Trifolium subterraneum]
MEECPNVISNIIIVIYKAAIKNVVVGKWNIYTMTVVEEVKSVLGMLAICSTTILFWTIQTQITTLSVSQSGMMKRRMGAYETPPAFVTTFYIESIIIIVAVYDMFWPDGKEIDEDPEKPHTFAAHWSRYIPLWYGYGTSNSCGGKTAAKCTLECVLVCGAVFHLRHWRGFSLLGAF